MIFRRPLALVLAVSGVLLSGCGILLESSFKLATQSRPPKWMPFPPGVTRANVSIKVSYYSAPWGVYPQFIMKDVRGRILKKVDGKEKCREPFTLKKPPSGFPAGFPSYEAITAEGVTEILEYRKPEPFFYVTDDASVWKQYLTFGCN